jgi:hypothetical protein
MLCPTHEIPDTLGREHRTRSMLSTCHLRHPSARFPQNWGMNTQQPYLTDVVLPTVLRLRELLGVER